MKIGPYRYTLSIELPEAVSFPGQVEMSKIDPTHDGVEDQAVIPETKIEVPSTIRAH